MSSKSFYTLLMRKSFPKWTYDIEIGLIRHDHCTVCRLESSFQFLGGEIGLEKWHRDIAAHPDGPLGYDEGQVVGTDDPHALAGLRHRGEDPIRDVSTPGKKDKDKMLLYHNFLVTRLDFKDLTLSVEVFNSQQRLAYER